MRIALVLFCLLIFAPDIHSQFYGTGQTPFTVSWKEINTEHFKVVFPSEIEEQAIKFTNHLETSYPYVSRSLGHKPGKIPVLLNNQSVRSNGYVVWAPKRMEIITTPPQNGYSQPWLQQLALHELRHVVQIDKLNKGWIKLLSYPFGQIASGGAAGFLPFWYLEGDAVITETALSNAGRGEQPEFKMGFRAITLDDEKNYEYRKAYFGSYKDYVPNYYELGYLMTSYARIAYNPMIWDTVLNYIPKYPYAAVPFHIGLKHFKTSKRQLYNDAFNYYEDLWLDEDTSGKTDFTRINTAAKKNDFIGYEHPQAIDETTTVVLKTSLNEIPTLYEIKSTGTESKIYAPGLISDFSLSYANGKLAWSEKLQDALWSKKNFAIIKIYDVASGNVQELKENTRFFSPDLSSDATQVVVIENTVNHQNNLCILDVNTGNVIDKIAIPDNKSAQNPRWNDDDSKIVMTLLGDNGKSIEIYDVSSGTWKTVLESTFKPVSKPVFYGDEYVIFNAAFTDIGNIYAIKVSNNNTLYQLTASRFGAYNADIVPNTNKMVYSDYSSQGYNLATMKIEFSNPVGIQSGTNESRPYGIIRNQENWSLNDQDVSNASYQSKKYNRFIHLFNFHSWMPFYVDLDALSISDPTIYPGVQLFSQNLLNTAITTLGYSYRNNQHFFSTTFTFQGMRPIFDFSLDYGGNITPIGPNNVEIPEVDEKYLTQSYRLYLPINLTKDKYFTNITPSLELDYRRDYYYDFQENRFRKGLSFLNAEFLFYRLREMALRDIHPKFGQVFQAQFFTSPVDRQNFGSMVRLYGTLYFPGIFENHSIILRGNFQNQEVKNYFLPYSFSFPRGYSAIRATQLSTLSGDYTLPLFYPDLDVFRFMYFKRVKATGFYDFMNVNPLIFENNRLTESGNTYYNSFGLQISTDFHLANILFPISAGYRAGYQPERNNYFGEFVFNLDIAQF